MSYKALIVDDEVNNREYLASMIARYCPNITSIAEANDAKSGKEKVKTFAPDVVFLDIEMPGGTGFDFLNQVESLDFKVIFVTAFDAYALKAIKYSALDYLLKPVDPEELVAAVAKLSAGDQQKKIQTLKYNLENQQNRRISLATQDEILFVNISEIIRLEAQANYTKVFLENDSPLLLSGNLGQYEKLIDDPAFYRTHQSHLINTRQIRKYVKTEGGYFLMRDNSQVPVARLKREEVKRLFL